MGHENPQKNLTQPGGVRDRLSFQLEDEQSHQGTGRDGDCRAVVQGQVATDPTSVHRQINTWVRVKFKLLYYPVVTASLIWCASRSDNKASACNAGDLGSIPGFGRSPGEGNGNQLQYSCLENSMDRGAWQATVHGIVKSRTQLSN